MEFSANVTAPAPIAGFYRADYAPVAPRLLAPPLFASADDQLA